jgi:hypothetical protein
MVIANINNYTSKELTKARQSAIRKSAIKYSGLHEEYLNHPKAQFIMSFIEYKKLKRNKKKFEKWIDKNPFN